MEKQAHALRKVIPEEKLREISREDLDELEKRLSEDHVQLDKWRETMIRATIAVQQFKGPGMNAILQRLHLDISDEEVAKKFLDMFFSEAQGNADPNYFIEKFVNIIYGLEEMSEFKEIIEQISELYGERAGSFSRAMISLRIGDEWQDQNQEWLKSKGF